MSYGQNTKTTSHSDAEKKTVMICDDERDLLELFGLALEMKVQCNSG